MMAAPSAYYDLPPWAHQEREEWFARNQAANSRPVDSISNWPRQFLISSTVRTNLPGVTDSMDPAELAR
jgi:hypothetical protein